MSEENVSKLRYPEYWDRSPDTWNVNDWDIYWIEKQPHLATPHNSHLALSEEIRHLKKIHADTKHPTNKRPRMRGYGNVWFGAFINKDKENKRIWERRDKFRSLGIESQLIDRKIGIRDGLNIARKGFQVYSEMDFDDPPIISICDSDDDDDEEIPALDSVFSSVPTNIQNWRLPSGKFVKDIFAENVSRHAETLKSKGKLTAAEKATLRYSMSRIIDLSAHMRAWFSVSERQNMMKDYEEILKVSELTEDVNEFIAKVEKMVKEGNVNGAYKYCLNQHADAPARTCLYKITKIYSDFLFKVRDRNDLLDCGGEYHTEIDVIVKACTYIVEGLQNRDGIHCKWGESFCPLSQSTSYEKGRKCDVRFLSPAGIDLGEWEFAAKATPEKAIRDRCRSARINQSILNGLLSCELTDEQVNMIKVPFLQIAGVCGQLLVEGLVNGFYVVFPGSTFELPTKLAHIGKLKSTIKIFNHVMEIYENVNKMFYELHGRNLLKDIFKVDDEKSTQCKSKFIHEPWWTPKNKSQKSQVLTAIEEMESKLFIKCNKQGDDDLEFLCTR
ncbi:929_t:CDS:10, partial [Funneliformis mosseae]